jgi:hypothetical protein
MIPFRSLDQARAWMTVYHAALCSLLWRWDGRTYQIQWLGDRLYL